VTINELRTNISILKNSTKEHSCKQEKHEEGGSSKKAKVKKGKAPLRDPYAKAHKVVITLFPYRQKARPY